MSRLYKNLTLALFFLLILCSGIEVNAQEGEVVRREKILESLVFKSVKMELWHGNVSKEVIVKNDLEVSEPSIHLEPNQFPEELSKILNKQVWLQH